MVERRHNIQSNDIQENDTHKNVTLVVMTVGVITPNADSNSYWCQCYKTFFCLWFMSFHTRLECLLCWAEKVFQGKNTLAYYKNL